MERPPSDPVKLLVSWTEWEQGESTPGRVMADLKTGGMREVLDHLASSDDGAGGLLEPWMSWERGAAAPTEVMLALQEAGLGEVVARLVAEQAPAGS